MKKMTSGIGFLDVAVLLLVTMADARPAPGVAMPACGLVVPQEFSPRTRNSRF
jgi:hypothetical protein